MRKKIQTLLLLIFVFGITVRCFSQVALTGPTCVVPGIIYQYVITGNWDSTTTMQVCLSGGVIADSTDTTTCTPAGGAPLASILVIWNGGTSGSLTLNSTMGGASLTINITSNLLPGAIDSTATFQTIQYNSIPASVNCSMAAGGSCSPAYNYQWQQSPDAMSWTDLGGSTSQNLSFDSALTQTTFFRRKVTEAGSGTISYSNIVTIDVLITSPTQDSSGIAPLIGEETKSDQFKYEFPATTVKKTNSSVMNEKADEGIISKAEHGILMIYLKSVLIEKQNS